MANFAKIAKPLHDITKGSQVKKETKLYLSVDIHLECLTAKWF
jgi:hypothetical protein